MERHTQVIFEALLTFFILLDILLMGLMIAGFSIGIQHVTIINIGNFDLTVSLLILVDLLIFRIRRNKLNENIWQIIRKNWAFIVSSIPITFICFHLFQLFGYIDIITLILILRFYALYKVLIITGKGVKKYPSKTKLDYATVGLLLVFVIGSYLFFLVEHGVNHEVPNYEAAMWFSVASMTTVGYGDIVPVTGIGRLIAVILIFTGMGYLSLVTATLAYSFIDFFRTESKKAVGRLEDRVTDYEKKIDTLIDTVNQLKDELNKTKK